MAEIAIAIVALGSLFILSNGDKDKAKTKGQCGNRENFQNLYGSNGTNQNGTPNPNGPNPNGPVEFHNLSTGQIIPKQINTLPQHTDKFFEQGISNGNGGQMDYVGLTGEKIDMQNFSHNNMKPFFGSKIRGATTDSHISESILDNMQGSGSQYRVKRENAPLFAPKNNMGWQNGAPNSNDFYRSRMQQPTAMNNVKLWEEERVAPGLNLGYTTDGAGGFNAGLEGRETHLPKTVDELRVETNAKANFQYKNPQGPASNPIQNLGIHGRQEKHLPDTYYDNGPERWLRTTGQEIRPTVQSDNILKTENREDTTAEYYGAGAAVATGTTYVAGALEDPKRQQLSSMGVRPASMTGQNNAGQNDYLVNSYQNLPNNRATTRHDVEVGGIHGAIKALVAPITDMLRPTRKDNVVGNLRENGNVQADRVGNYVVGKNKPKTTTREMTSGAIGMNHLNVNGQQTSNAYLSSKHTPVSNQRDTTSTSYIGGGNSQTQAMRNTQGINMGVDNVNKSYESRINQGGTQMFNQYMNVDVNKLESDRVNNARWDKSSGRMGGNIPHTGLLGAQQTLPQSANYHNQSSERLDPSLLSAFKNNPYTQSLNSCA